LGREDGKQDMTAETWQRKVKDFYRELIVKHTRKKKAESENIAARKIAKREVFLDISALILRKGLPLCGCR